MGQNLSKNVVECPMKLLDMQSYLISDIDSLFECFQSEKTDESAFFGQDLTLKFDQKSQGRVKTGP